MSGECLNLLRLLLPPNEKVAGAFSYLHPGAALRGAALGGGAGALYAKYKDRPMLHDALVGAGLGAVGGMNYRHGINKLYREGAEKELRRDLVGAMHRSGRPFSFEDVERLARRDRPGAQLTEAVEHQIGRSTHGLTDPQLHEAYMGARRNLSGINDPAGLAEAGIAAGEPWVKPASVIDYTKLPLGEVLPHSNPVRRAAKVTTRTTGVRSPEFTERLSRLLQAHRMQSSGLSHLAPGLQAGAAHW